VSGRLRIVGLGPGGSDWLTPEAAAALAEASDIVGYAPYVARVPERAGQRRHASDNRVEIERARHALLLAAAGQNVAVVSSGDPGIFAMAAAVIEAVEQGEPGWRALDIAVLPGLSAMQAAAARFGAPLGSDFCVISLSDYLKPWSLIARRLEAAIAGDFAIAFYNPASLTRRTQIVEALALLRAEGRQTRPVMLARALGTPEETTTLTTLAEVDPEMIDMRTIVLIGSSRTRLVERSVGRPLVYTPRSTEEAAS